MNFAVIHSRWYEIVHGFFIFVSRREVNQNYSIISVRKNIWPRNSSRSDRSRKSLSTWMAIKRACCKKFHEDLTIFLRYTCLKTNRPMTCWDINQGYNIGEPKLINFRSFILLHEDCKMHFLRTCFQGLKYKSLGNGLHTTSKFSVEFRLHISSMQCTLIGGPTLFHFWMQKHLMICWRIRMIRCLINRIKPWYLKAWQI